MFGKSDYLELSVTYYDEKEESESLGAGSDDNFDVGFLWHHTDRSSDR